MMQISVIMSGVKRKRKEEDPQRRSFLMPDTSKPPPPLPPNYKTAGYPQYTDRLRRDTPAELQMKAISIKKKMEEISKYKAGKAANSTLQKTDKNKLQNYCSICSESTSMIRPEPVCIQHLHSSSKDYRIKAPADIWGNYTCITCKLTPHSHKIGARYPVVLSSSLLHDWQGDRNENGYEGDTMHVDYVSIVGAKIPDLIHAFKSEYGNLYKPVDLLLCAGLEDIAEGVNVGEIMTNIRKLRDTVVGNITNPFGSFAATTLPLPPGLHERREDIIDLNSLILELNTELNQHRRVHHAPRFQTWGMKTNTGRLYGQNPRPMLYTKTAHKPGAWDGMDLDPAIKLRMGRTCSRYFEDIYERSRDARGQSELRDRAILECFRVENSRTELRTLPSTSTEPTSLTYQPTIDQYQGVEREIREPTPSTSTSASRQRKVLSFKEYIRRNPTSTESTKDTEEQVKASAELPNPSLRESPTVTEDYNTRIKQFLQDYQSYKTGKEKKDPEKEK